MNNTGHKIRSLLAMLLLAALSSAMIMCSTVRNYEPAAKTMELRKVQRVNSVLTSAINSAIHAKIAGTQNELAICPPMTVKLMLDHRLMRFDISRERNFTGLRPEKLTIPQLQELRTLINVRADEAFQAGPNVAAYQDLLSVQVGNDAVTGKINAPRTSVQIGGQ
jgi:hypothetical protein